MKCIARRPLVYIAFCINLQVADFLESGGLSGEWFCIPAFFEQYLLQFLNLSCLCYMIVYYLFLSLCLMFCGSALLNIICLCLFSYFLSGRHSFVIYLYCFCIALIN